MMWGAKGSTGPEANPSQTIVPFARMLARSVWKLHMYNPVSSSWSLVK